MKNPSKTRTVTDLLADLGERVRLRLLRILQQEELSVGEAASVVQLPQSTISRHLKQLSEGGWLVKRAEGTATLYRMILDELSPGARALWIAVQSQFGGGAADSAGKAERSLPADLAEDSRRLAGVLADRRTDSQAFFGRVAGQWDDLRTDLFGSRFTMQGLLALLPRDWTVADLGCGTGNASELLAPLVKKVFAIDQSQPMLAAAKKRLSGFSNITFLRGDLERIPLDEASVDLAVAVLVLHHVEDPMPACREMRRVVKPGGMCLIIDMIEHDRSIYKHTMGHRWLGFNEPRLGALLGDAGFADPRFVVLASDPDARGPGLFACTALAR
ncbi:MAG: ArsR/SmtB family transcription factor [Phycisphaerales bacterium]